MPTLINNYLLNLQSSTNWRNQYNPLRGLTIAHLVAMLEAAERGNYARLQWLYRFVEKRNPTLRAVLARRQAALTKLDWDIRQKDASPLAAQQAALLRHAYERLENLREAISFLALAEFRGYAMLERHFDEAGHTIRLQPVPQWFWARLGLDSPWQYNATARPGLPLPGDPVLDPAKFLLRETDAPVDEIAVIAHVRQSLSQKDWDGFIETYGLPPLFLELPPDLPAEREAEFQRQAEAIIGDARGTIPAGTRIHTVDSGARGKNPFADHLRYQDELIVLAATGGKLTMLAEAGSGTLAGNAHQQAFDEIAQAEAANISELLQRQFDAPLLEAAFPGQPHFAYFELAATRSTDPADVIAHALNLARAGYEIDPAELTEKIGYTVRLRTYPLKALGDVPDAASATDDANDDDADDAASALALASAAPLPPPNDPPTRTAADATDDDDDADDADNGDEDASTSTITHPQP